MYERCSLMIFSPKVHIQFISIYLPILSTVVQSSYMIFFSSNKVVHSFKICFSVKLIIMFTPQVQKQTWLCHRHPTYFPQLWDVQRGWVRCRPGRLQHEAVLWDQLAGDFPWWSCDGDLLQLVAQALQTTRYIVNIVQILLLSNKPVRSYSCEWILWSHGFSSHRFCEIIADFWLTRVFTIDVLYGPGEWTIDDSVINFVFCDSQSSCWMRCVHTECFMKILSNNFHVTKRQCDQCVFIYIFTFSL